MNTYFNAHLPGSHALNNFDIDILKTKMIMLYNVIYRTFAACKWFEGYGESSTVIYDYLKQIVSHYNVQNIGFNRFPSTLYDYAGAQGEYTDDKILEIMQDLYNFFHSQHNEHFNDGKAFMLYYENCRNYDPSYNNKASSYQIASQHVPWGYHAFDQHPNYQLKQEREWQSYLKDTQNITTSPNSITKWWIDNRTRYKRIAGPIIRCSKNMKGGSDVERSYNFYSKLMRLPEAASMSATTMENYVMGHWNRDLLCHSLFGCSKLKY